MNYIRHLQAFYHLIKRDERLSSGHVSLYLALFQYWNYNRFQNPFPIDREDLLQLSKIGSKNTYHKCMKDLHHYQYIVYHSGIKKYQNVKVSMVRMDLKTDEKGCSQLDLFNGNETEINHTFSKLKSESDLSQKMDDLGRAMSTEIDTPISTDFDTHTCIDFDTPPCPKYGTACVPILTATCPKNGTTRVPILGHIIKHKQINNKHCVCKTEKETHTIIFEKNKNLINTISKIAGITEEKKAEKKDACRRPNLTLVPQKIIISASERIEVNLPMVEIYFKQNSFPISEGQKFFYYNQGRGWMLTMTLPIHDWQALAHKWMLNISNPKCVKNDKPRDGKKENIDPRPGKDYSEPL